MSGGRGDVGAVDVDDRVENVASVGHVVGVGDHADDVLGTAAGHRDVQVPTCRRRGGEFEAGGDGVGLGAHLGRRVPETDMLGDVVGGEGDLSVAGDGCEGEVTVVVGVGDGPQVTVPDTLTIRGGQVTVVAARGDNIADVGGLATTDRHRVCSRLASASIFFSTSVDCFFSACVSQSPVALSTGCGEDWDVAVQDTAVILVDALRPGDHEGLPPHAVTVPVAR